MATSERPRTVARELRASLQSKYFEDTLLREKSRSVVSERRVPKGEAEPREPSWQTPCWQRFAIGKAPRVRVHVIRAVLFSKASIQVHLYSSCVLPGKRLQIEKALPARAQDALDMLELSQDSSLGRAERRRWPRQFLITISLCCELRVPHTIFQHNYTHLIRFCCQTRTYDINFREVLTSSRATGCTNY